MFTIKKKSKSLIRSAECLISNAKLEDYYSAVTLLAIATDDILKNFVNEIGLSVDHDTSLLYKFRLVKDLLKSEVDDEVMSNMSYILSTNDYMEINNELAKFIYRNVSVLADEITGYVLLHEYEIHCISLYG